MLQISSSNSQNSRRQTIKGAAEVAVGGYIASKAVTSGLRRALGIRIEEHTTSLKNAKSIIKDGCILNPKYGGSACATVSDEFAKNSKNFVHITGSSRETLKNFLNSKAGLLGVNDVQRAKINKIIDTPLGDIFRSVYRRSQKLTYRAFSQENGISKILKCVLNQTEGTVQVNFTKKDIASEILNVLTGHKSKTFYVSGTEEYFCKNFVPDVDELALKTSKPLKVCKTKIGAMIKGLKENGLSGIKQNKNRAIAGAAIFATLSLVSYKLIKSGIEKLSAPKAGKE